ncbi:hypothetical protein CACET_c10880 [Clostridium aceticum]|uniref:Uncharacterized protein n=1 Tax=Clostridium aceticum TaxID=84022 RepID=A0A0D8I890_9CLOT|nr:hypothetical protein [Clostridium aceticum]AKL94571.1 hypothetical protein CACET_c10880 [Clostridium aceticum]KJF25436.1 hypothetical protein TZ02_18685 [Clostridium aceticum]
MIAKIIKRNGYKHIEWGEGSKVIPISYKDFIRLPCVNPSGGDDDLAPYYDMTLREMVRAWVKVNSDYELNVEVFNFSKDNFRSALIEFVESGYEEFPVFMADLDNFVTYKEVCSTRYDIFMGFLKEFSRIVE